MSKKGYTKNNFFLIGVLTIFQSSNFCILNKLVYRDLPPFMMLCSVKYIDATHYNIILSDMHMHLFFFENKVLGRKCFSSFLIFWFWCIAWDSAWWILSKFNILRLEEGEINKRKWYYLNDWKNVCLCFCHLRWNLSCCTFLDKCNIQKMYLWNWKNLKSIV